MKGKKQVYIRENIHAALRKAADDEAVMVTYFLEKIIIDYFQRQDKEVQELANFLDTDIVISRYLDKIRRSLNAVNASIDRTEKHFEKLMKRNILSEDEVKELKAGVEEDSVKEGPKVWE